MRLHAAPAFADIAEGRLPRAGYAALLTALHRFHHLLDSACALLWADAPRSPGRIPALEADLRHLGHAPVPPSAGWAPPTGRAAALGCLYVAQGSTLGGRVIARQLDYLLPGADGRRFFAGEAADGTTWRALCAHLETEGRRNLAAMIGGAEAAFTLFEHCLDEALVHG
ncbi:biliverdin-producing heme oxygenase [Sphingosinicella sp. BN140058]|uniref:biliverdin-producing heme oxygenase n=1 Tax=Sphingosinicella sp. BN140058 TaxID=1892855 RepID=UPI0010117271|nr:biliverdin-producing heme oxygenase [Sphingosinicella sp. BN140058]QAY76138.1 hypothetical protein ETR14_06050 [Sphingosinicella sp. BN140058]